MSIRYPSLASPTPDNAGGAEFHSDRPLPPFLGIYLIEKISRILFFKKISRNFPPGGEIGGNGGRIKGNRWRNRGKRW
jgi:hypothetical protein